MKRKTVACITLAVIVQILSFQNKIKQTNQNITKVKFSSQFYVLIYELYFTSCRFPCDHVIRSIPLSNVNEKVAMLEEQGGIEADLESFYKKLFLIQDLYASGYRMADVGPDENGLVRNYSSMIEFSKNLKILSLFFSQYRTLRTVFWQPPNWHLSTPFHIV